MLLGPVGLGRAGLGSARSGVFAKGGRLLAQDHMVALENMPIHDLFQGPVAERDRLAQRAVNVDDLMKVRDIEVLPSENDVRVPRQCVPQDRHDLVARCAAQLAVEIDIRLIDPEAIPIARGTVHLSRTASSGANAAGLAPSSAARRRKPAARA